MSSNRKWFSQFSSLSSPILIALGDNSTIYGTGIGRVVVGVKINGPWQRAILDNVLYVPELHGNLLSVAQLNQRGITVHFTNKGPRAVKSTFRTAHCFARGSSTATSMFCPSKLNPL
jgi:hypothetical protein